MLKVLMECRILQARATHICLDCGYIYTAQKPFDEQASFSEEEFKIRFNHLKLKVVINIEWKRGIENIASVNSIMCYLWLSDAFHQKYIACMYLCSVYILANVYSAFNCWRRLMVLSWS